MVRVRPKQTKNQRLCAMPASQARDVPKGFARRWEQALSTLDTRIH